MAALFLVQLKGFGDCFEGIAVWVGDCECRIAVLSNVRKPRAIAQWDKILRPSIHVGNNVACGQ